METREETGEDFSFAGWLRTGRLIRTDARWGAREVKFNPNHDPKDGRFTFGDGSGAAGMGRRPRAVSAGKGDGSWGGGGFTGGGGGSGGGGGASGPGWMSAAEVRAFRHAHPGADPHMVTPGETIADIAAAHRLSEAQVRKLNGLPPGTLVKPGQVLALPRSAQSDISGLRTISKNGYAFGIDSTDRTHEAKGEMHLATEQQRSAANQKRAGGADRRPNDDGGHFIAARFGGPTDSFNHFAQDANFNRGGYRALEDNWAKEIRVGRRVSVDIVAHYAGASRRPDTLTVRWSVDSQYSTKRFRNEAKVKSHAHR